jgi:membrane protein YqaA with SNARE-associated domain
VAGDRCAPLTDLAVYAGLFVSAFTSATLLPGSSEAALVTLLALGRGDAGMLVVVATAGNVLGSCVNWVLGRYFSRFRDRRWFPIDERSYERAAAWFRRHGVWSLLLSWLPIVGDPLTAAAGALRVDFLRFVTLVSLGKAARYGFILAAFDMWNG